MTWPQGVAVADPVAEGRGRWAAARITRRLSESLQDADRVITDQDFDTEFRVLRALQGAVHSPFLFARQAELPSSRTDAALVPYGSFESILAASRVAMQIILAADLVLPSRCFLVSPPPLPQAEAETHPWPFPQDGTPTLAMAGALTPVKGVDAVLNALTVLRDRHRTARLMVLGDGPDAARLQVYAAALGIEAVFLPDWLTWSAYLHRADQCLAPQFRDGLGWEVAAASACGLPVLANQLPVLAERVENFSGARLLPRPAVMDWVEALEASLVPHREAPRDSLNRGGQGWMEALGWNS